jgi:hypothetical protein
VKTAVLAPIPSAKEITETAAKTGDFARERKTNRNSLDKLIETPETEVVWTSLRNLGALVPVFF